MTRAQISAAARTLASARGKNRDTQTLDMFGGNLPPAPPIVAAPSSSVTTTTRTATRRRGRPIDGEAARDDGIARAARSSGDAWQKAALALVRIFAETHARMTCDSARLWAESVGNFDRPPEPRAWGAVMRSAARAGFVSITSEFVESDDPACHRSPCRVWQSLVYRGEPQRLEVPHA